MWFLVVQRPLNWRTTNVPSTTAIFTRMCGGGGRWDKKMITAMKTPPGKKDKHLAFIVHKNFHILLGRNRNAYFHSTAIYFVSLSRSFLSYSEGQIVFLLVYHNSWLSFLGSSSVSFTSLGQWKLSPKSSHFCNPNSSERLPSADAELRLQGLH